MYHVQRDSHGTQFYGNGATGYRAEFYGRQSTSFIFSRYGVDSAREVGGQ